MTKRILKAALLAVFALSLMAGSALARQIEGSVGFSGWAAMLDKTELDFHESPFKDVENSYYIAFERTRTVSLGDGGVWNSVTSTYGPSDYAGILTGDIPGAPVFGAILQFRDLVDIDKCAEIPLGGSFLGTLSGTGDFSEYSFMLTELTSFTLVAKTDAGGYDFSLKGHGYVTSPNDEFDLTYGNWSLVATLSEANKGHFSWTANFSTPLDVPPPTVPEPTSLVLLGTGLLGAAMAARRKMKK